MLSRPSSRHSRIFRPAIPAAAAAIATVLPCLNGHALADGPDVLASLGTQGVPDGVQTPPASDPAAGGAQAMVPAAKTSSPNPRNLSNGLFKIELIDVDLAVSDEKLEYLPTPAATSKSYAIIASGVPVRGADPRATSTMTRMIQIDMHIGGLLKAGDTYELPNGDALTSDNLARYLVSNDYKAKYSLIYLFKAEASRKADITNQIALLQVITRPSFLAYDAKLEQVSGGVQRQLPDAVTYSNGKLSLLIAAPKLTSRQVYSVGLLVRQKKRESVHFGPPHSDGPRPNADARPQAPPAGAPEAASGPQTGTPPGETGDMPVYVLLVATTSGGGGGDRSEPAGDTVAEGAPAPVAPANAPNVTNAPNAPNPPPETPNPTERPGRGMPRRGREEVGQDRSGLPEDVLARYQFTQSTTFTRTNSFPLQLASLESGNNAPLLYNIKNPKAKKKDNVQRASLKLNPLQERLGKTHLAFTGQALLSTNPLDTKSQVQFSLVEADNFDSHGNRLFYQNLKLNFTSNQVFTNKRAGLSYGIRDSFSPSTKPIAYDEDLTRMGFAELDLIGAHVLQRDSRIAVDHPNQHELLYLKPRFVYNLPPYLNMPITLEGRAFLFPVSSAHGGYSLYSAEAYGRAFVTLPGTKGKVNIGYEAGMDEATFTRNRRGQVVFDVTTTID